MKKRIAFALIIASAVVFVLTACSAKNGATKDYAYEEEPAEYNGITDMSQGKSEGEAPAQKLIKRYRLSAETKEYEKTLELIDGAVSDLGGYFEKRAENNSYGRYDARLLTAVIRIPEDKAESFLSGIKGISNVKSFTKTAENVTEAYIDAEARLQSLEAEREGLLNMISSVDSAKEYDFWLTLHREISDKEQDIASLKARLRNYDNLVSYATFELDLTEVKEYTEPEKEQFGTRISTAFTASWKRFAENFKDFAVSLVSAMPTLLTFTVISVVIFLCVFLPIRGARIRRRKSQNDK